MLSCRPSCAHSIWFCPQPSSTLGKYVGPHSSDASPPTSASRPASTVTRNLTVRTAVMSLAAVSESGVGMVLGRFYLILSAFCSQSPLSTALALPAPPPRLLIKHFTPTLLSPVPPQVVTPPQQSIQASRGQTVTFTCVAIGVPTPIINWRLNWGHIPVHPRCNSVGGVLPMGLSWVVAQA